jgi:uncharacterized iron-regulated protein
MILFVVVLFSAAAFGQDAYKVFDGKGNASDIDAVIAAADNADVIFLGEEHDDPTGHALEAEIFERLAEKYQGKRKVILSLEMFERDVQIVIDEYLSGLISEQHFLSSSRPWPRYKTDYRPLVEYAKAHSLRVVAANAPRRYVNMVSRLGRDSLTKLSPEAKTWLAPLPYPDPSEAYSRKFNALMGGSPESLNSPNPILYSQALWDATMADSVRKALDATPGALVVHLNGGFHTESRLGTFEQLIGYRPKTKGIVVTMKSASDVSKFTADAKGLGDFVILTDSSLPRSK